MRFLGGAEFDAQLPLRRVKAPLCKGSCQRSHLRDCKINENLIEESAKPTIPPSRQAVTPPFTQGRLGAVEPQNYFGIKVLWLLSFKKVTLSSQKNIMRTLSSTEALPRLKGEAIDKMSLPHLTPMSAF